MSGFYDSREWLAIRYEALKASAGQMLDAIEKYARSAFEEAGNV